MGIEVRVLKSNKRSEVPDERIGRIVDWSNWKQIYKRKNVGDGDDDDDEKSCWRYKIWRSAAGVTDCPWAWSISASFLLTRASFIPLHKSSIHTPLQTVLGEQFGGIQDCK